jgi:diguanylate cyclase (GGDEF)-like protein
LPALARASGIHYGDVTPGIAAILFTLGAVGWWTLFARMFRAREDLIASALAWVALVGAVWATLALLQTQSNDLATRTLLLRGTLFLAMVMPPAWWVLALRIADPPWLRRWHLVAFAVPAVALGAATLATPAGSGLLAEVTGVVVDGRLVVNWAPGPWLAFAGLPYAFTLLALAVAVLLRTVPATERLDRATASTLVAAMLLPSVTAAARLAGLDALPGYDLTGLALGASVLLLHARVSSSLLLERRAIAYEAVFRAMPEPALVVASDGTILEANPATRRLPFGGETDLRRTNLLAVSPQLEAARRGTQRTGERRVLTGELRGLEVAASHLRGADGHLASSVLIVHDRREDRAREAALLAASHRDALTGVANRPGFEAAVGRALAGRGDRAIGIAFIDLDGFKAVNDTHGHAVGDAVLVEVATRLKGLVREGDVVARFGGDEFAVLLPDITAVGLANASERMRTAIERPITADEVTLQIGSSIGLASSPRDGSTIDALIARSDARMYRQKEARAGGRSVATMHDGEPRSG